MSGHIITFKATETTPKHLRHWDGEAVPIPDQVLYLPAAGHWGALFGIPGRMGPGLTWLIDEIPESERSPIEQALRAAQRLLDQVPMAAEPIADIQRRQVEIQHQLLKAQAAMLWRQHAAGG